MRSTVDKVYYVYIMASGPRGVPYVGMTSDMTGRGGEHRERVIAGFTRRYWVDRLVYFERHESAEAAAKRERQLKRWRRLWKIELIEARNPTWADLYETAVQAEVYEL